MDQLAEELKALLATHRLRYARKSYIHPAVIDAWLAGKLDNGVGEKLRRSVRTSPSSSRPEAALRRFLAQHQLNGEHQATINAGTSGASGC